MLRTTKLSIGRLFGDTPHLKILWPFFTWHLSNIFHLPLFAGDQYLPLSFNTYFIAYVCGLSFTSNLTHTRNLSIWCLCDRVSLLQRCKQPTTWNKFSFINLFKSALHVSSDKFAHHQEQFLTVYTAFGTMHRLCCRPVAQLWHRSAAEAVSPEICWADLKRLINE